MYCSNENSVRAEQFQSKGLKEGEGGKEGEEEGEGEIDFPLLSNVYCGSGTGTTELKLLQRKVKTCPRDSMNYLLAL